MIAQDPLVTVYIVNHNYERFVSQAIESVLTQTLRSIEIIIIDDGSTDGSRDIIEKYRDTERVIIITQQNRGLNVTNNIALRAARGRYIMRLDADDYLDPRALAILSNELDRHPETGLVFPDYYLVDASGNVQEIVRRHDFSEVTLMDQPAHGACTMIRREFLEEIGGYDEAFRCQDGYDLWLRFIERFNVKNVNLPLFYYRQHATNLTRSEGTILDTRTEIIKKQALRRGRHLNAIAVIPVRDHNTDPHSIALRPLGNKLVIDWTIESALAAERIGAVLVSTPDTDVIKYVEKRYGSKVTCIKRDLNLAQINSFTRPTLFHAVQEYASRRPSPDAIAELFIEFPFRTPHVIDSAIDLLEIFSTDRVVGVRPETDGFYTHEGNGLIPLKKVRQLRLEREDIFRVVGAVSVTRPSFLESDAALDSARLGHVVVDQKSSFCIRSEWDWEIAQLEVDRRRKNPRPSTLGTPSRKKGQGRVGPGFLVKGTS